MKRLIIILFSFLSAAGANAQSSRVYTRHLQALDKIQLKTRTITDFTINMLNADSLSDAKLPTAKAVADFVRSKTFGGGGGGSSYFTKNGTTLFPTLNENIAFGGNTAAAHLHHYNGASGWSAIIEPNNYGVNYGTQFGNNVGVADRFYSGGYHRFDGVNLTTRPNVVGSMWAYNSGLLGGRVNNNEAGFNFRTETYYQIYGQFDPGWFEFHLPEVYSADNRWTRVQSYYISRLNGGGFSETIIPQQLWYFNRGAIGNRYLYASLFGDSATGTNLTLSSLQPFSSYTLHYTLDNNTYLGSGSFDLIHGDDNVVRIQSINSAAKQNRITLKSNVVDIPFEDGGLKKLVLKNGGQLITDGGILVGTPGFPDGVQAGNAIEAGSWEAINAKLVLEVRSTSKASKPFPHMTQAQRLAMGTMPYGAAVLQIDGNKGLYIHDSIGWVFYGKSNFYFTNGLEALNDSTAQLTNTGVTAGTYGSATQVPQITVDAKGRISSVTNVTISGGGQVDKGGFPETLTEFLNPGSTQDQFIGAAISSGTNSTAVNGTISNENHPGVVLLRSSTTANSGYYYLTSSASNNTLQVIKGGEQYDEVFRTTASFTNTTVRMGYPHTTSSSIPLDGIWLEYVGNGNVVGRTGNAGAYSTTATIATLAADTWYHARITVSNDKSTITYQVFNEAGTSLGSATITTTIPAADRQFRAGLIATNSGTTATDLIYLDFQRHKNNQKLQRGNF